MPDDDDGVRPDLGERVGAGHAPDLGRYRIGQGQGTATDGMRVATVGARRVGSARARHD